MFLEPLTAIVKSIATTEKVTTPALQSPNEMLQKYALRAIQLLSKILAKRHPDQFANLLKVLSKILKSSPAQLPILQRAYLIETIGELCANLRVHAISHLYSFMPLISEALDDLIKGETSPTRLIILQSVLRAILRIVETLPLFLTQYLVELIANLSILWSRLRSKPSHESQKSLLILNDIWQKLSSSLELRVLIPMIEKNIYPNLLVQEQFDAIGPLMVLLSDSFELKSDDVVGNYQELTNFFIGVMGFRATYHHHPKCKTVDLQEDFVIETFVKLIFKLSETSFRPLYNKLHEWSKENVGLSFDRAVTFYR